jgi:anaerobic selenocysteine-containing dehydrogenase/Fe-S-cluster-containing dehydrogenase component
MAELDRRDFLKLVGAGAGAAAAAGCSEKVEQLIPYVVQPEEVTPGVPVWYASTCGECAAGCGVHVKTREGRPIKLEGNPLHPVNQGALCAKGQVSLGRTYHPDRFAGPMRRGADGKLAKITWDEAVKEVAAAISAAPHQTFVLGGEVGPTLSGLLDQFVKATGAGGRVVYEPFAPEALRAATQSLFGVASVPIFDLSNADLIVDFGSDFLESGPSPAEHARQFAAARDVVAHPDGGARLVSVSPRLSNTTSNAEEWIPAKPGSEGILALALARIAIENGAGGGAFQALLGGALAGFDAASAATKIDVPAAAIERLGKGLARAKRGIALPPGIALTSRRAVDTAAAVLLLNHVLGAVGRDVKIPAAPTDLQPSYKDTLALVAAMGAGSVGVLLVHGTNPAYSLPKSAGFAEAVAKVKLVVSFATMPDETTEHAHLVLPDHSALESWGDASPRPGVRSLLQPTVRPLVDSQALGDSLLAIGRAIGSAAAALPQGSFRSVVEAAWAGDDFRAALERGGSFGETPAVPVSLGAVSLEVVPPALNGDGGHVLVAFPHGFLSDGRGANLPWLQEIPDNVSKVAWSSWVEISPKTAEALEVEDGDFIAIETSSGKVEGQVLVRGGIRDDVVAVPIGQGHTVGLWASKANEGEPGQPRGFSALDALPANVDEKGGRAWLTETAKLTATGAHKRLPLLQFSDNQRKRKLGDAVSLVALAEGTASVDDHGDAAGHGEPAAHGEAAGHGDGAAHGGVGHEGGHEMLVPFDPAKDAADGALYRWGMSVDLDKCTGCGSCIAACYVENNIPLVGEAEVRNVRPMSWLRIDRWVGDGEDEYVGGREHPMPSREKLGEVDVRHAPMMCQHCGSAPCEPVCPVIATYHNEEGLNGMAYNRCIGTRYCANNCSYKVRRFNYFDHQLTKWPEPMRLMLNPDVTVRGQGVMEKCTFCVQRIQFARQVAKNDGRTIREGDVQTACQQACSTGAIKFGNLRDPQSEVTKLSAGKRSYVALHPLNTRPAVNYLARVSRGAVEES